MDDRQSQNDIIYDIFMLSQYIMMELFMNMANDEKNKSIIEEQAATIRLLTDLTEAGSCVS